MRFRQKDAIYKGADDREHTYDLMIPENYNGKFLLFMHGFMGFKDWGCWGLMMDHFLSAGYGFCRFNITHNGTTLTDPIDFADPESFGNNTYYKELIDLRIMIRIVREQIGMSDQLVLVGHSRGGGMVLIGGNNDQVSAVISLAGIADISRRFPSGESLDEWRRSGVRYVHNSRTKQDLPQYYVQFEDFKKHKKELEIQYSCQHLKKPVLLIHGDNDTSVSISEGYELAAFCGSNLEVLEGADHVFNASHPWESKEMPENLIKVCDSMRAFLQRL